jgi:hypothetical protein
LVILFAVMLPACELRQTEAQMPKETLTCTLKLTPIDGGDVGMTFDLRNPGNQPVNLQYFQPFVEFSLTAQAQDGDVPLVQAHYDTGVQPISQTLGPGQSFQLETPIRLRFDPNVDPSGGNVLTRWTLRHAPVPVTLRATLHFDGLSVAPCEARLNPSQLK